MRPRTRRCLGAAESCPTSQFINIEHANLPQRPAAEKCQCRACRGGATSPFSLPRAYLIGRPVAWCGVQCCPFVRVSCRSPNSTSPTRATCCGHLPGDPCSILVRHARFPRDMLATSSRWCHEDVTRKKCFRGFYAYQSYYELSASWYNITFRYFCTSISPIPIQRLESSA